jgi:hypothetical protein
VQFKLHVPYTLDKRQKLSGDRSDCERQEIGEERWRPARQTTSHGSCPENNRAGWAPGGRGGRSGRGYKGWRLTVRDAGNVQVAGGGSAITTTKHGWERKEGKRRKRRRGQRRTEGEKEDRKDGGEGERGWGGGAGRVREHKTVA